MEHIVFLTGRLAERSLIRTLEGMAPTPFSWEIREIGLQVAALMTADLIRRRIPAPLVAQRVIVPGRCRGDLAALTGHYGVRFERGPEEVKDLPQFFGREAQPFDLTRYETEIFAEIVAEILVGIMAEIAVSLFVILPSARLAPGKLV